MSAEHTPVLVLSSHLCLWCSYNLRGLTFRTCSECGGVFALADARRQGAKASEAAIADRRAPRVKLIMQLAAIAALGVGLFLLKRFITDPVWRVVVAVPLAIG